MSLPQCYGKDWDQNDPICAGGRDPTYTSPEGTHMRERCDVFNSCCSRKQALDLETAREAAKEQQKLIPTSSLFRSYQNTTPTTPPATTQELMLQQMKLQLEQQKKIIDQQAMALQQRPAYAQQQAAAMGQMLPLVANQLEMMSMSMAVPKYLSVPEPRRKDTSIWHMLVRELVRSIFKAAGHTVANFWDHTPFDREE